MVTAAKRNQQTATRRTVADRALENQRRMILSLMLQGIKIYLTPAGKALLWEKLVPERVDGGGLKITYRGVRATREVG